MFRGPRTVDGGKEASVVVSEAVQVAAVLLAVHVAAVPRGDVPFMNCTEPVGAVPPLVPVTVAVKVMLLPEAMDVTLEVTTVELAWEPALTVTVVAAAGPTEL